MARILVVDDDPEFLRAEETVTGARFVLTLPADDATRQLAASIDSFYSVMRAQLAQAPCNLLVARLSTAANSAAVDQVMQRFEEHLDVRVWKISSTTWVALSDAPVRQLYRRLADIVALADEELRQGLHVQVRCAGRTAPVDELVLQSVVRCRRTFPAWVLQKERKNSRTEVA